MNNSVVNPAIWVLGTAIWVYGSMVPTAKLPPTACMVIAVVMGGGAVISAFLNGRTR